MYLCVLASWGCHNKLPQTWWCKWQKFILKVWRPKVWSQGVTKLCPLPSLWIKSIPPLTSGGMISLHHVSTGDGSDLRTLQIFALVHWTDGDQTYEPSIVITNYKVSSSSHFWWLEEFLNWLLHGSHLCLLLFPLSLFHVSLLRILVTGLWPTWIIQNVLLISRPIT